jgi:hypothetical protein
MNLHKTKLSTGLYLLNYLQQIKSLIFIIIWLPWLEILELEKPQMLETYPQQVPVPASCI